VELLGLRVCPAKGKTGDDDGVQRATHRVLFRRGGILSHVDAHARPRRLGSTADWDNNASSAPRSAPSPSSGRFGALPVPPVRHDHYSPDATARPGTSVLRARRRPRLFSPGYEPWAEAAAASALGHDGGGDPYEAWARELVGHRDFSLSADGAADLCSAVAASAACAAKAPSRAAPELRDALGALAASARAGSSQQHRAAPVLWGFKGERIPCLSHTTRPVFLLLLLLPLTT